LRFPCPSELALDQETDAPSAYADASQVILLDALKSIPVDQLSFTNNDKAHSQGKTREKGNAGPWRGWGKDQEPVSTRINSVTASERASLGYNNAHPILKIRRPAIQ
jgi:hypothetical protein